MVGFDNWQIIAAATRPPLTTIDMNLHELGRQAGFLLLDMIEGRKPQRGVRTAAVQPRDARVVRGSASGGGVLRTIDRAERGMNDSPSRSSGEAAAMPRHLAVPFTAVELRDGLWAPRQQAVREHTVPFLHAQYEKNGLFEALDVDSPPGPLRIPFNNRPNTAVMYWDSDIAKWIEMASYTLAAHYDPALDAQIDDLIARIAKAQRPDGYFNTYFIRREPAKRWTNLRDWHELYCAGHMIEAAVAHAQVTGKSALVDVVRRYADYIATVFGPGPNAAARLLRPSGNRARAREAPSPHGRAPLSRSREVLHRRARPAAALFRPGGDRARRGSGGAVSTARTSTASRTCRCASSARSSGTRCARCISTARWPTSPGSSPTTTLMAACRTLWEDLTTKRLYVTGGLGPSARNEGFTADYDLPNETAYAETCAAVGLDLLGAPDAAGRARRALRGHDGARALQRRG